MTAIEAVPAVSCSFCRKPHTAVAKLVAGPGVYICDACAALAVEVAAASGPVPQGVAPVMPWERDLSLDEVLALIGPVAGAIAQADANLRAWVAKARHLGASWAAIGDALGVTRQTAWERFAADT